MRLFRFLPGLSGFLVAIALVGGGVAAELDVRTVLDGKIIRALAVDPADPSRALVGQKGGAPGSALVLESRDGGETWRALNGGASLSPEATDVQAVAVVGGDVVLAGTWKHGLFVSRDSGGTFERHAGFPSSDIRDFHVIADGGGAVVYAATARDGVFLSTDAGETWRSLGPGRDFFWSLAGLRDGRAVYAVSLEKAVYSLLRPAGDWRRIFRDDDGYALAAGANGTALAIAAQTGAYLSPDQGTSWRPIAALKGEKLSSVLYVADGTPLFGSWSDGLIRVDSANGAVKRILPGTPVVHLAVSGDRLLVGTWGQGLKLVPLSAVAR